MMKAVYLFIIFMVLSTLSVFAQEEGPDNRPVRNPFEGGTLIDNQTVLIQRAKTLEAMIEHRFGLKNNGIKDLWGIYAPSNIRLGLNYSIFENLEVGYGYAKDLKIQDLNLKWNIVSQTRSNSIPIAVTFYGNMGINSMDDESFGENYKFTNRFSYFGEIIIARKFNEKLSLQIAPSFSHLNSVDSLNEHDKIGISFSGRYKFSPQSSVMVNYNLPLELENLYESHDPLNKPKSNLAVGWEISTGTHVFQIFIGTANYLNPQYNMMKNQNDWTKGEMMFGFNMTRLWNF